MVKEIKNLSEFNELIGGDKPTLIDFHATWCGPCKQISPFVDKLEGQIKEINFAKVDVDDVPDVAQECGVRAMPTFMAFKSGEKVGEVVGANPTALKNLATQVQKA
ncbi:Thioredoxin [Arthrobotrys entomopaga]|nr:Thioredoxin [Arthrobotrys entomopaga]